MIIDFRLRPPHPLYIKDRKPGQQRVQSYSDRMGVTTAPSVVQQSMKLLEAEMAEAGVTIGVMKIFDIVYVMTGGNFKTSVIGMEFWNFYSDVNYGTASAIVVILMIAIIPIMIFQVRQFRREEAMR